MLVSLTQSGLNKINDSMFVVEGNPEEGFELTKDLIFMLGLVYREDFTRADQFDFPKRVLHIVADKEEAELLTSLNAKGCWEEGFYVTVEFCKEYQLGMPIGTNYLLPDYCLRWDEHSLEYVVTDQFIL